ncbi:2210538d-24ce-4480-9233-a115c7cf385e [Thermothielavioides terrestris]|uniref:2210538d-24ce-4480-9233-a115c7cf385e n=1 Tax=Thermothielavioides terrestris TaxID=2587410 RepID=A0A446BB70_9PEZI|nr:2210538d-24ce-4480-9233-a115c7cf385e [Thermothielavioides terrestris]
MGWTVFLLTYLFGGITFLPLLVIVILAHAYFTLPYRKDADASDASTSADGDLIQPGDDLEPLKAAQKDGARARGVRHEPDVAAGYFAVCREYTPMGINAKPIERSTPVGSATVAAPSPSVYQTMYRSIFDRKQAAGPLDNKNGGSQRPKRAGNVFYVVLRHGHLMLFDDDEQLEVRHVISLAHHDISVYSGEPVTPEGELFIKRNAICLSRRAGGPELGPDSQVSKPFYLFSENCSAKEDFYLALLRNQEQTLAAESRTPTPIQFDVKNIISLVQRLHSSEEHMHTRWLNAMIGRVFLGVHKTKDMENFIREKLTKKISRVKRPAFLSNIAIKAIDTGESAPYITNPRLKDLTVEGECGVGADVRYTGNFRLEVAATARIDLGSRFKAREVNLVLAVVLRRLEGHVLFKIKPPPSNRIWFSFQQMPKLEMTIEPIVSSRQITYTVILRQIENRIKEVIAETLVLPFWDDVPFFGTEHKKWRGGIFHDDTVKSPADRESAAAQEGEISEVAHLEETHGVQESDLPHMEKSHSLPVLEKKPSTGLFGRKVSRKASKTDLTSTTPSTSSSSIEVKNEAKSETGVSPPALSAPFVQPSSPTKRTALNAVANAAASAKRWGLNAFQRRPVDEAGAGQARRNESASGLDLSQPMGRGQPLPPPGTPLPMPEKRAPTAIPKRKPIPPPSTEPHGEAVKQQTKQTIERRPVPPPPLPKRRHYQEQEATDDNLLVVAAPADSEPTTPLSGSHSPYVQPWVEDAGDSDDNDLSKNAPATVADEQADTEAPSLAAIPDGSRPEPGGVAGMPESAVDDDDFSAWMDGHELEHSEPPTNAEAVQGI